MMMKATTAILATAATIAVAALTTLTPSAAHAGEEPLTLRVRASSYLTGANERLVVLSDGTAYELKNGGPFGEGRRMARLDEATQAAIDALITESKLLNASFTQPDDPMLLVDGGGSLLLRRGGEPVELQAPRVAELDAGSKALCARIGEFKAKLKALVEPHLKDADPKALALVQARLLAGDLSEQVEALCTLRDLGAEGTAAKPAVEAYASKAPEYLEGMVEQVLRAMAKEG